MNLKNSLFISCAIHCSLLVPSLYVLNTEAPIKRDKPLVVDYVVVSQPLKVNIDTIEPRVKNVETPRLELNDRVAIKPPVTQQDIAKREAQVKSTKDYINYYQLLREKIRRRLKANYVNYYKEGEVACVFVLNSNGTLVSVEVEKQKSIADKKLQDISLASIKESAPFPPFPKEVNLPKMSFNVSISFKKE